MAELDELKIPKAVQPVAGEIIGLTDEVCQRLLDAEYAGLARQVVAKLTRKRPSPLLGGGRATWAAAVVYALGQVNFLFDSSREPYRTADELSAAFGIAKTTMGSKAKQVRETLKMSYFAPEFLRADMVADNPALWFVEVDGLLMDARSLPLDLQTAAFRRGYIPWIPALGREGTAELTDGDNAGHQPRAQQSEEKEHGHRRAAPAMNRGDGEPSLHLLIERSAELKRDLVRFARGPRFEQSLTSAMLEAAGPDRELDEVEAIRVIDRFALQCRLPDGKTVVDRFLATRPDLTTADREMLLGWRDPVEGIFDIRGEDGDAIVLLNLLDDLEYRTYSNMGRDAFRSLPGGGFVYARLVPIGPVPGAWLVSGSMSSFGKSDAASVAQLALELATRRPEWVFRNPEKVEQGWAQMRADRAAFVEFFGADELVLPPAGATERLNAYYRRRREAARGRQPGGLRGSRVPGLPLFRLPPELAGAGTVAIIYDQTDGLNFYPDYGMLRDLFADPALAADKRHADALRGYLESETIGPLPFRRLAAAHPDTTDAVFRKILREPQFTWSEDGEALLRRRKAWYYQREPRPSVSVIGARLSELAGHDRQE